MLFVFRVDHFSIHFLLVSAGDLFWAGIMSSIYSVTSNQFSLFLTKILDNAEIMQAPVPARPWRAVLMQPFYSLRRSCWPTRTGDWSSCPAPRPPAGCPASSARSAPGNSDPAYRSRPCSPAPCTQRMEWYRKRLVMLLQIVTKKYSDSSWVYSRFK